MISIYTELGSLFDERRMILCKLARETVGFKFDWVRNFQQVYQERLYDVFEYPEFGITDERYKERFERRSKEDFADRLENFLYPSKVCRDMFNIVREYEFGVGKLLSVSKFTVTVNTWPYELNDEEQAELIGAIKGTVSWSFDVNLVHLPPQQLIPHFLHGFDYVFKYDYMLSPHMGKYWELYETSLPSRTKIVVPGVFKGKVTLTDGMEADSPKDLIFKLSAYQGGKVTWIPCDKSIYDSYS
ncbi:hypothetical protein PQC07_gp048 [Aeromonas phage D3]|uniref:Uncharacterized protein n=3 Tax=Ludhianavirus TaxID=3044751 RepID=A0A514A1G0_9CAUD|nr:hypothetical protein PQC06_gp141 [Aeromonas phage LAh10]YP_010668708.1 hypothetical protein PQC07_gp048 [Aeromonas phage D3]YP_010668975.1 hypothetical protein PQC08_gp048 [Aeromonas phage D6]QEP52263.1 hypothetical protein D9_0056 [Aeromonas phage D9]QDH47117.1 hypothetical protein LAh10_141 [Aeromonas phage LAh10]QDJ96957.1 hypothetical protein D3_0227 [Aeromonas phage D3]QDJ97386.1 hypothetical protein D6_0227 [Aeromonas phage D6]